jgi:hypothetical protein
MTEEEFERLAGILTGTELGLRVLDRLKRQRWKDTTDGNALRGSFSRAVVKNSMDSYGLGVQVQVSQSYAPALNYDKLQKEEERIILRLMTEPLDRVQGISELLQDGKAELLLQELARLGVQLDF